MSAPINFDNDKSFWNEYLNYPMEDLLNNLEALQNETENKMEIDSIEDYLNKDLFPIAESPDESEMEINNDNIIKTSDIMEHALPQFIFPIDKIPPFYFLLQAEKPRNPEQREFGRESLAERV